MNENVEFFLRSQSADKVFAFIIKNAASTNHFISQDSQEFVNKLGIQLIYIGHNPNKQINQGIKFESNIP